MPGAPSHCEDCGKEFVLFGRSDSREELCVECADRQALTAEEAKRVSIIPELEHAAASGKWEEVPTWFVEEKARDIVLTTSISLPGIDDYEVLEIISAECVYGMNIFRDMMAGLRDVFGGRSAATQKVLRDARKVALTELRREALMVGANAVIAVDLNYSEFSGGTKSGILIIVASGTAIKYAPANERS